MALSNEIDLIYKSLRVLPEFDGNQHVLTRFINLCDQLVLAHIRNEPGYELTNLALINGILNKITGPAARLINSNGIPETWAGIKSALINNFADHRDETALYSDLSLQTQGSSSPQEFYERVQGLFSTIMTYISLHETLSTTIEAKRALYQKLTLQAYLRGLKDPLGSRIRCMRPETMEKALEFVQEELNTLYLQQRNEGGHSRKEGTSSSPNSNLPLNTFIPKPTAFNMPLPSRPAFTNIPNPSRQPPMQSFPIQNWRPNPPQMHPPRGPTRTQQMMRAPPPNYNPQSNVFKLPNRPQPPQGFNFNNNARPTPMSGVTPFVTKHLPLTGRDWRQFGNPPPSNYFKTREVNFNETDADYNYSNDMYFGPDYDDCSYYDDYYAHEQYPYYEHEQQYHYQEAPVVEEVEPSVASPNNEDFRKGSKPEKRK